MSFWLDDPGRRPAGRTYGAAEPDEPEACPEPSEPVFAHVAPQKKARRPRRDHVLIATTGAMGLHGVLAVLLVWSASKTKLNVEPPADAAAMFASLTPASSISLQPSVQPPSPARSVETVSDATEPPSQTLAATSNDPPPTETKEAPSLQSADVDEAALNTSRLATANIAPLHADTYNPWAHASVAMRVPSMEEKLWAAIKPCLQDSSRGSPAIRLILDNSGRVQRMTDVEGGEAQANPKVQALARAAAACAPYDRLVQSGGSYLIVAPS